MLAVVHTLLVRRAFEWRRLCSAARGPPPPDQLASLYKLVDIQSIAGALGRHARVVELSASAALQAEALFGGDVSLVVANLRMGESQSLSTLAASGAERELFVRRASVSHPAPAAPC